MQERIVEKPKVLICVDWFVPGYKAGGPIQSCKNLVQGLKDQVDFHILTSDRDWGEPQPYAGIATDTWLTYDGNVPVLYASPAFLTLQNLEKLIRDIQPDCIYLNSMFSVKYTIFPLVLRLRNRVNSRIILAPRGMLQGGALSFKPLKKKIYLKLINLLGLPAKIEFHATDELEAMNIRKQFPGYKKIHIIGNFPSFDPVIKKELNKEAGKLKLVYLSRISPEKNLLLILQLLNSRTFEGDIELTIGGKVKDEVYYAECLKEADKLPANIQVHFAGAVPHERVLEWLQQFHVFILPTFGENFGHAIFEAFLAGRPVIISDRTLWRGLEEKGIGWDIPLDDTEKYINTLNTTLNMTQEEYTTWSDRSRDFAENYRKSNENSSRYLELFQSTG